MTNRENYLSIARRRGYEKMPVHLEFCPSLHEKFRKYCQETGFSYTPSNIFIQDLVPVRASDETFLKFFDRSFRKGTYIDDWGVVHEPGSAAAFHMTRMHHPMEDFDSVEQILSYPFPEFAGADETAQRLSIRKAHEEDKIATANMQVTIWEIAWYLRGMENLMTDIMLEDPIAEALLDKVTELGIYRAESFARNGADVLFIGDDVGMQSTLMMSEDLYCTWLKPRLTRLIAAAKAIKPDIVVLYHSCGFVTPLIPHLIDAGVDVLNPVQPECMDFKEIHSMFGDRLSFHGTIGTQTTMPFGTPDDVRREVFRNLEIAGDKGGLFVAPTHMLEPDVPVENVVAYIEACRDFK